jgi:hypothetical protein
MRKLLYIFLSVVILLSGFLLGTPYLLTMFDLDQKLKDYVITQLSEDGQTLINVNDLKISYGKIELREIEYKSETARAYFNIRGIEFDFDFFTLIRNIKEPHRAIDKIVLVEPRVDFKEYDEKENVEGELVDSTDINILEVLYQFENIDRIHLKNGSLSLLRKDGEELSLAKNLNGWIDSRNFTSVNFSAYGDIFYGSDANFEMFGQVNLRDESFFIQLDLQDYELLDAPLAKFNEHFRILEGIIDSKLDIKGTRFDLESVTINGYVSLINTDFTFFDKEMHDLEVHAQISENKLVLNDGRGRFTNSVFTVAASIEDIFNPVVEGEIRSDRMDIKSIADNFNVDGFEKDYLSLRGKFRIEPGDLSASGRLFAPQIVFNDQEINSLNIKADLENSKLSVNELSFEALGFGVDFKSTIDLVNGDFATIGISERTFGEHFFFDNVSNSRAEIKLDLSGSIKNGIADGVWNYRLVNPSDTVLAVDGQIKLEDNIFTFSNDQNIKNDFLVTFQVANIFEDPKLDFGYVENFPFYVFTTRKWVEDIFNRYKIEGMLVGTFNNLNTQISVKDKNYPKREFAIISSIKDLIKSEKKIGGKIQFNKLDSEYSFTFGEDYLKGVVQSNHSLIGSLSINMAQAQQIKATLDLKDFEVNKLLTDTTLSGYGEINGRIEVNGSLDDPKLTANLKGDRFIINDMGYYSFDIDLQSDTSRFLIDTMKVALNNRAVLSGSVDVDYKTKWVEAIAEGKEIDTEYILKSVDKNSDFISGKGDYQFQITGPIKSPQISGSIKLTDGIIENIPFDEILIGIKDSLSSGGDFLDYKNHHLNISEFVAVKGGQYHLEGSGNFPLYDDGEIDLNVKFDGDVLWLIPKWDDFFMDGASFTTMNVSVSGTPSRPNITHGYARIDRGELWLKDVARHIENINGEIYFEENSNFIVLKNINAVVDGNKLSINNEKVVETSDGVKLKPWYFKEMDLNFGILALQTSKNGVELTIPSLMMEGESGSLALSGKTNGEKFYLAGPVGDPYAWGEITLSDSRITFPFPPGDSDPSNAIKFLRSIYWDIQVTAGKDLEYVRQVPGILGEVNTELNIDPSSEGLIFSGIIENETFYPEGELISSRGRIDYLDLNFRVENFGFVFNKGSEPEVYGRAWTSVRDSVGATPKTIYLELYSVDEATGMETRRARWEDFRFRLVSADPTIGESQEQVLAYLGYSVGNVEEKAKKVGGAVTDNYLIRPLLRPIERGIEKYLGIDFVRFNARIAENLLSAGTQNGPPNNLYNQYYSTSNMPYAWLIQSSEFTVGKYLTQNLYLTYTGQIVALAHEQQSEFSLNHSLGVEYRFLKNLLFEFEYDREMLQLYQMYDKSYQEDFKVRFRYSFSF